MLRHLSRLFARTGKVEMSADAQAKFKNAEISAVIIRADGTIEDLGVIASTGSKS